MAVVTKFVQIRNSANGLAPVNLTTFGTPTYTVYGIGGEGLTANIYVVNAAAGVLGVQYDLLTNGDAKVVIDVGTTNDPATGAPLSAGDRQREVDFEEMPAMLSDAEHLAIAARTLDTLFLTIGTQKPGRFTVTGSDVIYGDRASFLVNPNGVTALGIYTRGVTVLDISNCPNITELHCPGNPITSLDVAHRPLLTILALDGTALASFDLTGTTNLTELTCSSNYSLTSLDVSGQTSLTIIDCGDTRIHALDLTHCPLLVGLDCNNNPNLTSLDLTQCTAITGVNCNNTSIASLDISQCPLITVLSVGSPLMLSAAVNDILANLVSHGLSNGTFTLDSGSEQPTGQGLLDVATLRSRGWSVTLS